MTDRVSRSPGQYKGVIGAGELQKMQSAEEFIITLKKDDNPTTEGTPYNKASVLPDELATELCPDTDDPTPADALQALNRKLAGICEVIMPVGYIFEWSPVNGGTDLSTAEKVKAYYGFGTWEAYGAGRMMLGASEGYAVATEGGEAAHLLTVSEMPSHCHDVRLRVHGYENWDSFVSPAEYSVSIPYQSGLYHANFSGKAATVTANADTGYTGNNKAHNNMPPYVVVYRWRRIA